MIKPTVAQPELNINVIKIMQPCACDPYQQANRKMIIDIHYVDFKSEHNTYTSIYNSVYRLDWDQAQAHIYTSSLESALGNHNIPFTVYETLVIKVKANTAPLQRYEKLRKKILGLEEYYFYDGTIEIVEINKTCLCEEHDTNEVNITTYTDTQLSLLSGSRRALSLALDRPLRAQKKPVFIMSMGFLFGHPEPRLKCCIVTYLPKTYSSMKKKIEDI